MTRRNKAQLLQSNYYAWLAEKERLQTKKKSGDKLTADEKRVVQFNPTPENPWKGETGAALPVQKQIKRFGVLPSKDVDWPIAGGGFVCTVKSMPCTDEDCMLFCTIEGCPFYLKGYMRSKGLKF
jgi:hypothetical protein